MFAFKGKGEFLRFQIVTSRSPVFNPKKMKSSVRFLQVIGDLQRQQGVWWGSYCKRQWQIQSYVNKLFKSFLEFWSLMRGIPRSHIGNLTQEASITITPCPPDPELPEVQNLEPQSSKTLGDGLLWGRIPNGFVENPGTKWVLPSVVGHYHLMATRLSVKKESHVSKIDVLSFHTTVYGVLTEMRNLQNALLNGWIFDFVLNRNRIGFSQAPPILETQRQVQIWIPFLKLIAMAPENRPFVPKGNFILQPIFQPIWVFNCKLVVRFRECKLMYVLTSAPKSAKDSHLAYFRQLSKM